MLAVEIYVRYLYYRFKCKFLSEQVRKNGMSLYKKMSNDDASANEVLCLIKDAEKCLVDIKSSI